MSGQAGFLSDFFWPRDAAPFGGAHVGLGRRKLVDLRTKADPSYWMLSADPSKNHGKTIGKP